ncbi:hypothetical protein HOD41_09320 [bacterium]|nr:hypothetical protein [bacterium]
MRIELTRNTVVAGKPYGIGDIADCSDKDGKYLIAIKKAVLAPKVVEKVISKIKKPVSKKGKK